jgi:hypothetical protein
VQGALSVTTGADVTPLTISGYSLTGANTQSALSITGTWNTTGSVNLININVTNTASDPASRIINAIVNGSTIFTVNRAGGATFASSLIVNGNYFGTGNIGTTFGNLTTSAGSVNNTTSNTITTGINRFFLAGGSFTPTSGTGVNNGYEFSTTINQTGGANGITRGLFINPTLTSAADWRSIEWSNNTGRGLWGVGTANNAMAGALNIGSATNAAASAILEVTSTTQGFLPPRMTETQRDAIVSPAIGLQIFNTTAGYLEYFDSFWGWMPINNSNEWKRRNGTEYFNDFGQNNSFSDGVFQTFPLNGGGALTTNPLPNTNDYIGYQGLSTGLAINGGNGIRTDLNAGRFFNFSCGRKSFISRIWVLALSTVTDRYTILNGFSNSTNSTMTTGACFIYDEGGVGTGTTASPNWQIITANGGVRTNFVTSVPVNITTWYSFRIESNANDSEIYYYINDILVRTEITNIPVASIGTQPIIAINKNTGTTNRGIAVDYLGLKIKLNTQR